MADATPTQYQGQGEFGLGKRLSFALAAFLGLVLLLKLAVVWQMKDLPLLHPDAGLDTTAYANLARRVVAGNLALGPGLYFVSPLYIYFLAAGLWAFDSFTAVRVLQVLLGTGTVACIFLMTRDWFGTRAAWIAAVLAALTGLFTFYESLILQSSIDAFLTAAGLRALTIGLRADPASGFRLPAFGLIASGTLFALATLNRPNMAFGAAAVLFACLALRRWRQASLLVAGLLIGLAPSLIRNVVVAGEWSLVSSHGGLNLYIGNHENATGFYREVPGIRPLIEGQQEDTRKVASAALGREVTDSEASAYFRGQALSWMAANPVDAAALFARKIFYTFHAQHVPLPHSYPFFAYEMDTALQFLIVGPWLLVPLGLTGLLLAPRRADYLVWLAFVPGYAIGVALFFVAERYRLPLFVPLCVGAGAFVDAVWRAVATKRAAAAIAPLAVAAGLAVAANWPLPLNDGRWNEGLRTAQRLVITGDYDQADAWAERLERNAPRAGQAHHGVALQLIAQDQPDRALKHLRTSLERGYAANDDAETWLRMGRLSTRSEGPEAAEPFFRRAVQIAPEQASARQQYGLNLLMLRRIDDANRELSEAVRLDPRDADSLAHLAYCEIKLGRGQDALRHLRAALALQPDHALARQLAAALRIG